MISHLIFSKPVLLVGNGVRSANAVDLVYKFYEKTNIPILTTLNGVDLAQDKYHIGFIGTHGNRVANLIINSCDIIISVGARLGIRQVGRNRKSFAPKAKLIRCDIDQNELDRNIKNGEIKYQMDARFFLENLLNDNIKKYTDWNNKCFKAKDLLSNFDITEGNLAIRKISELLPANPVVSVDVGQNQCWAAQSLHLKGINGRILISGGFGIMGCALPYAIGASIYSNRDIVYCIVGDGGFQMNIQELETIKRERLPIKILVLNNKVLGKIYETQRSNHNSRFANTADIGGYTVPDFKKVCTAYGIRSVSLKSYIDLDKYKNWFYDNEACMFDIALNSDSYLYPKIKWETNEIFPQIDKSVLNEVFDILS